MKPYVPVGQYKESKKLNALVNGLVAYFEEKLFKQGLEIVAGSKKIEAAKGALLDALGDRIGIKRPLLVDDTLTRYVVTDRLEGSFLESRKGKVFFPSTNEEEAGKVFFKNPIGPVKKSGDEIYRQFLLTYIARTYQGYNHEAFITTIKLFLGERDVRVHIRGFHIGVEVSGSLSPLEISYFSSEIVPLPSGRVITYVKDENGLVYSDPRYQGETA